MKNKKVLVRSTVAIGLLILCFIIFKQSVNNIKMKKENEVYRNQVEELNEQVSILRDEIENLEKNNNEGYETPDTEYKIFYGEWEITEFMGRSRYCYGEKQEYFIGRHIYYDEDKIEIDGQVVMEEPVYMCGLIPCKYWYIYTWVYPANTESVDLVWGRQEDFFAHVHVKQYFDGESTIMSYGNTFYIVDEDTLVLDTEDGWYKMERMSYIEGYPDNIYM